MERMALLILFCISISIQKSQAQCMPAPAEPACNPSGSSELTDNDVVSTGEIKVVSSVSSFSGLTMDGGTLIVCGNLTLPALSFNSGTIYIKTTGSLTITGSGAISIGANSSIYNFGTYTSTQILVAGANTIIHNCRTTSAFNQYAWLVIQGPNASIVNNGLMDYLGGGIVAENTANSFCLEPGSEVKTSVLETRYFNVFDAPSGPACIYIRDRITNVQVLTANSDVNICKAVSATESGDYGNATVHQNCSSCGALPVELTDFSGYCQNGKVHLTWTTASEKNNDHFVIERSRDGMAWEMVGQVKGAGNSTSIIEYFYEDASAVLSSIKYYRLKQSDYDGTQSLSKVISIECEKADYFTIYPNPVYAQGILNLTYKGDKEGKAAVKLFNSTGQMVYETNVEVSLKNSSFKIEVPEVSPGLYSLRIFFHTDIPYTKKILVSD